MYMHMLTPYLLNRIKNNPWHHAWRNMLLVSVSFRLRSMYWTKATFSRRSVHMYSLQVPALYMAHAPGRARYEYASLWIPMLIKQLLLAKAGKCCGHQVINTHERLTANAALGIVRLYGPNFLPLAALQAAA